MHAGTHSQRIICQSARIMEFQEFKLESELRYVPVPTTPWGGGGGGTRSYSCRMRYPLRHCCCVLYWLLESCIRSQGSLIFYIKSFSSFQKKCLIPIDFNWFGVPSMTFHYNNRDFNSEGKIWDWRISQLIGLSNIKIRWNVSFSANDAKISDGERILTDF